MAKYLVEGFLPVKMEVEADSEDEALEMAEENFVFDKHIDEESLPKWETANSVSFSEDEDDESYVLSSSHRGFNDEDEDDY